MIMRSLESLNPPAVDPAHAPVNIKKSITVCERCGRALRSTVVNPAVEMIEVTWKKASLMHFPRAPPPTAFKEFHTFTVMMAVDARTIAR